jgi:hypothetical protein
MALDIEKNTIGTTTQNIRFINSLPSGSRTVAPLDIVLPSSPVTTGHIHPTMQPATIAISIAIMKP